MYILNQDSLGLKKGAVATSSNAGNGYVIYLDEKRREYIGLPKSLVENSSYFEKEEEKIWNKYWEPKVNEDYWYTDSCGDVEKTFYSAARIDEYRIENGNCFKTEYEANMWKKRLEALAVKQTAIKGKDFYVYDFKDCTVTMCHRDRFNLETECKKFATIEECDAYGKEYYEPIMFFNK